MTGAFFGRDGAVAARVAHDHEVGGLSPSPAFNSPESTVGGGGALDPAAQGRLPGKLSGNLALMLGCLAFKLGKSLDDNSYVADSGHHIIWRHGWRLGQEGRKPLLRRIPRRNVQRETQRPGRGRALNGRRSEWSEPEDEALLLLADRLHRAELAIMLDRSERGVGARLCRLRKQGRAG